MINRMKIRMVLLLAVFGLLAADLVAPLIGEGGPTAGTVLAQSKKRSKAKRKTTKRRSSRRRTSRRRSSRTVQARAGYMIPSDRILEIQQALVSRGYLEQPTGKYDQATIGAMKEYQKAQKFRATGYPTAKALHGLGLPLSPPPPEATPSAEPDADLGKQ